MAATNRTLIKPVSWPANHRAALAVLVHLDPIDSLRAAPVAAVHIAATERLLSMLADLDIVPSAIIDADAEISFPIPAGTMVDPVVRMANDPATYAAARAICVERLGAEPAGVMLPAGQVSLPLEDQEVWFLDGSGGSLPLATENGRIIVPLSPWWHDATWFSAVSPAPPSALLEAWSASLASVRSHGELMTIVISGQVSSHPGHLEAIQRFLDEAIAAGDVWISNGSGVSAIAAQSINR